MALFTQKGGSWQTTLLLSLLEIPLNAAVKALSPNEEPPAAGMTPKGEEPRDVREARNRIRGKIRQYAKKTPQDIDARLDQLDREWDMDRVIKTNAAILAGAGLVLGLVNNRRWLAVPGLLLPLLLQRSARSSVSPWLNRVGVRNQREINAEKYALRALRGDFDAEAFDLSK